MTIDEAIKHAEEVAEEQEKLYKLCPVTDYGCKGDKHCNSMSYEYDGCLKCAEEHRQLAECLKELKQIRNALGKIRAEILLTDKTVKDVRTDGHCFFTADEIIGIIDKYKAERSE